MKNKFILLLSLPSLLISCNASQVITGKFYNFDTLVEIKLFDGDKNNKNDIGDILNLYGKLTDNYRSYNGYTNVYSINQSNDELEISEELYGVLSRALELKASTNGYFNPLVGSLVKKWKNSLKNGQILDENIVLEEIEKINNSSFELLEDNKIRRNGEAEIDLGAIAKGYALDVIKDYLDDHNVHSYIIDGGSSSILLGEKKTKTGLFSVGLKDIPNAYVNLKNCFIGASGTSMQGVKIADITYSHIVNPFTGSTINNYDFTFVVGSNGALCDVLSTSFMMMSVDEIKEMEETFSVKSLVYKDGEIVYKNEDINLEYH